MGISISIEKYKPFIEIQIYIVCTFQDNLLDDHKFLYYDAIIILFYVIVILLASSII